MNVRSPAALLPLLFFILAGAASLRAQQPATDHAVSAVVPSSPAPASAETAPAPAPRPSPLFERADERPSTIAPATEAHAAAKREGTHTIRVTTTVLVLCIIILVLLI